MSRDRERTYRSRGPADTRRIAARLARRLEPNSVVAVYGDLGSGKTCFVQGLARGLGVTRAVTSPTFTLLHEYEGRLKLYHFDLYRVRDPTELTELGWDECLSAGGVTVVEWAERAGDLLPEDCIAVSFRAGADPRERILTVRTAVQPPARSLEV